MQNLPILNDIDSQRETNLFSNETFRELPAAHGKFLTYFFLYYGLNDFYLEEYGKGNEWIEQMMENISSADDTHTNLWEEGLLAFVHNPAETHTTCTKKR